MKITLKYKSLLAIVTLLAMLFTLFPGCEKADSKTPPAPDGSSVITQSTEKESADETEEISGGETSNGDDNSNEGSTEATEPDAKPLDTEKAEGSDTEKPSETEKDNGSEADPTDTDTGNNSTSKPTDTEKEDLTTPPITEIGCGNHTDVNDDGKCDTCDVSVLVIIDFYTINDLHGKFKDTDSNEGVDELTTFLKNANKTDVHTVFLSSGDMWQGSSESNLTHGLIITDWMNELDFASMTLGNHEFDWGEEYIELNHDAAEFPFLAINVFDKDTHKLADYCTPSVVVEKGGLQIGIIGAIGDCYSSISGEQSGGFYFKVGDELTELVKAEADRLRSIGVDYIVYSIHDGHGSSSGNSISNSALSSYYDIELSEGYVDLVFEGHTHQKYTLRDQYGVYHMQNGGENKGISHVEVYINVANENSTVTVAEFVATSRYSSLEDDPIVEQLLEKYKDQIAKADEVLGQNDRLREGDEIRQLSAELYYKKGVELWGDEYEIVLGGGFFTVRSPYDIQAGYVKYSDIQSVLPFDNKLVLCSIQGKYLKSKFFETNNANYFISYGDYGAQVKANIDLNATYYVVVDTYTSSYAPNNLTVVKTLDEDIYARDLIAEYIKLGGWTSGNAPMSLTSIPDILAIGNALADNGTTSEEYLVEGKIVSISNATYGNMIIEDGEGNQLTVYGCYSTDGLRYDSMTNQPAVGDTVVLRAPIKKYVSYGKTTVELFQSTLISIK